MNTIAQPRLRWFRRLGLIVLPALAILVSSLLAPWPVMAMPHSSDSLVFAAMSNKMNAAAKNAEGKLESAYGELTGDTGHQIKGKAKQVQASAMNTAEDIKQGAKSVSKKVAGAAKDMADDLS
jgi:uncharacterized protein YjbJ (UPF0337 family)